MDGVQWIKLYTDMFDTSRKIKYIEQMPRGDTFLIIWIKMLLLAGRVNDGGALYITPTKPYDKKSLAAEFRRPVKAVAGALDIFEECGMIERSENGIRILAWQDYQNVDRMAEIREQTRERTARSRARKKADSSATCSATVALPSRDCSAVERENKNIDIINPLSNAGARADTRVYGAFQNVLLTEAEYEDLSKRIENVADFIEKFSRKLAAKEYSYQNHYAAMLDWYIADQQASAKKKAESERKSSFEADEFFAAALKNTYGGTGSVSG
ncbi:MAG: hypothetical protein E7663_07785 [Ruminococcaceae bacterium]|nr:hypothetical protein [Oscillospiraceae bacterium]